MTAMKFAERIIAGRMQQQTKEINMLRGEQFGFRYKHSTEHQIIGLLGYASHTLRKRQPKIFCHISNKIMQKIQE